MKLPTDHKPQGANATLADCARLWRMLTNDYIPGLRIEISIGADEASQPFVLAELVDYAGGYDNWQDGRSVWATKKFFSPLYLISHTQLFDLLIKGYRVIDEYFVTGKDNRPSSPKG